MAYIPSSTETPTTSTWLNVTEIPQTGFTFNDFHRPFRLAQVVSGFFLHTISLYFFLRIIRRVFRGDEASKLLKTLLIFWIIEDILALPYVYIFIQWVLEQLIEDCKLCGRYTIWVCVCKH